MRKDVRELIEWAVSVGYCNDGFDGNGHYRLRFVSTGQVVHCPATPSKYTSIPNTRGQLRRVAGIGSDSPRAASYRYRPPREQESARLSSALEVEQSRKKADLLKQHRRICDAIADLQSRDSAAHQRPRTIRAVRELLSVEESLQSAGIPVPVRSFRIWRQEA